MKVKQREQGLSVQAYRMLRHEVAQSLWILRRMRKQERHYSYCVGAIFNLRMVASELRYGERWYPVVVAHGSEDNQEGAW